MVILGLITLAVGIAIAGLAGAAASDGEYAPAALLTFVAFWINFLGVTLLMK